MGETGSVAFMFDRVGQIVYPADKADADTMFEAALEAGADEVESSDDEHELTCEAGALHDVLKSLEAQFGEPTSAKLTYKPNVTADVGEEQAATLMKLLDALDDNDDVQNVYASFDISDEIMEKLSA